MAEGAGTIEVDTESSIPELPTIDESQRQIWTFASSGWLFAYHFGVVKLLKECLKEELKRNISVVGSSGGACAGAFLFLDVDTDRVIDYICECAVTARSHWRNALRIHDYVKGAIDRFMTPDAAEALSGRLEVSLTTLPWLRNVRVCAFAENAEVADAVLASSCVFAMHPVWLPSLGASGIDGGYSDFQILKGVFFGRSFLKLHSIKDAVSVCPSYHSRADIRPSRYIPPWWAMYPPEPAKLRQVYELGYRDALSWLAKNGRIPYGVIQQHEAAPEDAAEDVPLWLSMLQETAAQAQSCEAELGELVLGAGALLRSLGRCLLWLLVTWELLAHAIASAAILAVSPLLPNITVSGAWQRFGSISKSAISPALLLKTIPAVSSFVAIKRQPQLQRQLSEYSLLYRFFQFLL